MPNSTFILVGMALVFSMAKGQELPFNMEELTAPDFVKAVEKSGATCIIPIGVFEKHGAHMPLGTDLYIAREIAARAAEKEYTVVFPWYYFSQINEARHQPGTIAYSHELIWNALQETLDELSRNGFKKIVIVNGHGGNNAFLDYFGMSQLDRKRNYQLYWFRSSYSDEVIKQAEAITMHDPDDGHGGNTEASLLKAVDPDLVISDRSGLQSGKDQKRMNHLQNVYTGIWWYARFPNHYAGDASKANAEAGEILLNHVTSQLVVLLKTIKTDAVVPALYEQFYLESENPLNTKQ